jgi:hypothetical protein
MADVVRVLLSIWALSLGACKTSRPKDETPIFIGPTSPTSEGEAVSSGPGQAPEPPPVLAEPLQPVRGGVRVLPPYRGPEPCKMALTGDSPVARACSEGGQRRAIDLMQSFVRRARAEGIVFVCADCHADEDDYTKLNPHADAEFRKLLFLARPPE